MCEHHADEEEVMEQVKIFGRDDLNTLEQLVNSWLDEWGEKIEVIERVVTATATSDGETEQVIVIFYNKVVLPPSRT
ncbi:MAG: hypothetical protein Q7S96_00555 [bacterium]|nr:hypothetical protein [bacterium]